MQPSATRCDRTDAPILQACAQASWRRVPAPRYPLHLSLSVSLPHCSDTSRNPQCLSVSDSRARRQLRMARPTQPHRHLPLAASLELPAELLAFPSATQAQAQAQALLRPAVACSVETLGRSPVVSSATLAQHLLPLPQHPPREDCLANLPLPLPRQHLPLAAAVYSATLARRPLAQLLRLLEAFSAAVVRLLLRLAARHSLAEVAPRRQPRNRPEDFSVEPIQPALLPLVDSSGLKIPARHRRRVPRRALPLPLPLVASSVAAA